ncbi:innexin inx7 isoform X2 [Cephus cinctus]|nr:innexin inx7 isoform X2 [Cephus cinctus]
MSTFTVVKHMNATVLEQGSIPHPGIGPVNDDDPIVYHAYYQWVPFVLFFQAILFYLPHAIWKNLEDNRLNVLVSGLHVASLALGDKETIVNDRLTIPSKNFRGERIWQIRQAFINRLHINKPWAYYLGLCELLNFVNVLMQIYITDKFLGGTFLGLADTIADGTYTDHMDPLDIVFPKVTKCTFHKYGPSGSMQKHDALCVMALNIINEKIYTFLWFWFAILAILTGLGLLWRILTMILHARSDIFNRIVFSMASPGKYNPWTVLRVTNHYSFGDWLFIYYIAKNLDSYVFKDLFEHLARDLENRRKSSYTLYPEFEEEPLTMDA